ncbi:MAG: alpha/beta hydrolase, partial [Aureispira sp.]|nr:alpha/beta hydrolase [Aureispira sp.]
KIATDTVIMYCHGNAAHMDVYWPRAQLLANVASKNQYGVLMIDYRGYGKSEGTSTESGLYADVNSALEWLKGNGLTGDRLVMYGFSMGTAPATELTANPQVMTPSKLILEAPFASAEVMAQDASKLAIPGSFLTNLKIDNAEEIKKIQQPFLWLHGEDDDFLSIHTHGSVVAKGYQGSSKTEVRVDGAGHSTVPNTMGYEEYMDVIKHFLQN